MQTDGLMGGALNHIEQMQVRNAISVLGAMTGSRLVDITPWPGVKKEKAYLVL